MCKFGTFQRNLSSIFLKLLNIYLFSEIFQKVKIIMLRWNILQYLTNMLTQYFSWNERLEIFLTCCCNILCYVGCVPSTMLFPNMMVIFSKHAPFLNMAVDAKKNRKNSDFHSFFFFILLPHWESCFRKKKKISRY